MFFDLFKEVPKMAMVENVVMEQIDECYLTLKEVLARYKIARGTVYNNVRNGKFPAPLKFGKSSRWRLSELLSWETGLSRMESARNSVPKQG